MREGKLVVHVRSVEMPKTYTHAEQPGFVTTHLTHGTVVIDDHIARTQSLRQAFALVVDNDRGNTASEICLRILEPIDLHLLKRSDELINVLNLSSDCRTRKQI